MTTANAPKQPTTPYDQAIVLAQNRVDGMAVHPSEYEHLRLLKERQVGYVQALADLAPLHRQLVEALVAVVFYLETGMTGAVTAPPLPGLRAALDAARKAGLL